MPQISLLERMEGLIQSHAILMSLAQAQPFTKSLYRIDTQRKRRCIDMQTYTCMAAGISVLHAVGKHGYAEMVDALLQKGAFIDVQDSLVRM